ncbi:MAG: TIM barrel protein [Provencibacterium sp.]|jgi:sugar phosphate isomerase/epimerase|nr:TIM barrel protein [Provencibacterium sp.]
MKICIQTGDVVDDFGFERGYRLLREIGFEGIDWNIDHALSPGQLKEGHFPSCIFERPLPEILDHYREEIEAIQKSGLSISQAHAPFPAHVRGIPQSDDYMIEIYKGCIRLCDAVGCKNLIIHGISCSPAEPELSAGDVDRMNAHLYESLIPVLKQTKVTVCLENLFTHLGGCNFEGTCSNPFEAVRYIDALNEKAGSECFGLCLDTGHLNLLRKNLREYVRILGRRIKALHIHDNDSVNDQHLLPFAGTLRWNDFTGAMKEIGYQGDLSFETFNQTRLSRMDIEYIPVFLRAIHDIGEIFRERIQG